MKCETVVNVLLVTCLCLWQGASGMGAEDSRRQGRLSLSELEKETPGELEQEQARLARLLSDVDAFRQGPES